MTSRQAIRAISLSGCAMLALGCGSDLAISNLPGGNPLVPEVAAYPYPSDLYLVDDPTTATGRRLDLPDDAMPGQLPAAAFSGADGYSRAPSMLAWFDGGVDPTTLPDVPTSFTDESSVWLIREQTWQKIPVLVEVDHRALTTEEQGVIIRPQIALEPDTGYIVILRDLMRGSDGSALPASDAFRALRDGIATDVPEVEAQRDDFELVNQAIAELGVAPDSVVLAWSFHTRSRDQVQRTLLAMHDVAMTASVANFTITSDALDEAGTSRLIEGFYEVPDFLGPDQRIEVDAAGDVIVHGTREAPFLVAIPVTVGDQTRPVIIFGHGLFQSRFEIVRTNLNDGLQQWRMSAAGTDFTGLDVQSLNSTLEVFANPDQLPTLISRLMQSHANVTSLARLVTEQLATAITAPDGTPLFDAGNVHYLGVSNGGIQGSTILAASPVFRRGALVVPGGCWTHLLQRSVHWNTLGSLLDSRYRDGRELQLVLALMQIHFDPIDGINWMDELTDRPAGRPPVSFTMHEAVGDMQVPNMITEWLARAGGVPLITPSPRQVFGLDAITAPPPGSTAVSSALFLYDEQFPPVPDGNRPPDEDNLTHVTVRELPSYRENMRSFLEHGTIVQVCEEACDPD